VPLVTTGATHPVPLVPVGRDSRFLAPQQQGYPPVGFHLVLLLLVVHVDVDGDGAYAPSRLLRLFSFASFLSHEVRCSFPSFSSHVSLSRVLLSSFFPSPLQHLCPFFSWKPPPLPSFSYFFSKTRIQARVEVVRVRPVEVAQARVNRSSSPHASFSYYYRVPSVLLGSLLLGLQEEQRRGL